MDYAKTRKRKTQRDDKTIGLDRRVFLNELFKNRLREKYHNRS